MSKLTEKQQRFADEYLIDLNATQAYIRAGYKAKGNAAEVNANRLLRNAKVQSYIQERMKEREKRTEITQDMVLRRWWAIATADPNSLTQLRRLNCRYCHGTDHAYQWRDEREYDAAVAAAIQTARAEDREPDIPVDDGGYGYNRLADPHPDCPRCLGEGVLDMHLSDTRKLDPKAKQLYAGIKQTQAGIEIKTHDQLKASELVARHLGMFVDRVEHSGGVAISFEDALKEIMDA